ncbi:MAG: HlyD family efflux transporter periplasmic adaptor subunit [Deltaproteobacteria bacterium]|nr:HlyD family efflux transporter periplasmic adaptor subunit [Deltaproteobacteria bacterium]
MYDQLPDQHLLMIPFDISEIGALVAVFLVEAKDMNLLQRLRNQVQHGFSLLNLSETRVRQNLKPQAVKRLTHAIDIALAVNQQEKFTSAAMAFCNEVASEWHCERVSLGFLKGQYVQVKAMNHTEEIYRKMELIQDIESAMEECLDQDTEILVPAPKEATYIDRSGQNLSGRGNPRTVLSLPLRQREDVFAVLTLERVLEKSFAPDEIETLRLGCELCTARLADLYQNDRWFGSVIAERMRKTFTNILGPTHTWAKVAGIGLFLVLVFLIFAKGQFRPDSPFVLETVEQQVIPAPFDGFLKTVEVDIGQTVRQDESILATLDTAELRLQLAAAQADRAGYLKQVSAAMRDSETAQAQISQANADKAQSQIDLLEFQISQSQLTTPLGGVVVKGDLKRQIGAPVRTGDILFEICPLESIRAQLLVPDDLVLYLQVGQEGRLATASYPDKPIRFVIERIDPMAEVVNQRNVFKVRARLTETYPWMRPGMEGVAKVEVGKKRYVWIWTRKATNWLRMKLWL